MAPALAPDYVFAPLYTPSLPLAPALAPQDSVFEVALGSRLFKLSRETEKPPFAAATASTEPLCNTASSYNLTAVSLEGGCVWGGHASSGRVTGGWVLVWGGSYNFMAMLEGRSVRGQGGPVQGGIV